MEGDNVSNAGFLYGAWEEGFHPILLPSRLSRHSA